MKTGETEFEKVLERGYKDALAKVAEQCPIPLEHHEKALLMLGVAAGIDATIKNAREQREGEKGFPA